MYVTPEQRDRAESWLKEAYADGRISEVEFDSRIGQVLTAETRKELNEAFYGLVQIPTPSRALGVHPAYQPLMRPETRQQAGRGVAGLAHFSVFFLWLLGPGLVFALSSPGTYARREAAKAFNFQLISFIAFVVVGHRRRDHRAGHLRVAAAVHGPGLVHPDHRRRGQGPAGRELAQPGQECAQARGALREVVGRAAALSGT